MSWTHTPEKEISFEHCGQPAYWTDDDQVICSKCQDVMPETCIKCNFELDNWDNNPFMRYCDTCKDLD